MSYNDRHYRSEAQKTYQLTPIKKDLKSCDPSSSQEKNNKMTSFSLEQLYARYNRFACTLLHS